MNNKLMGSSKRRYIDLELIGNSCLGIYLVIILCPGVCRSYILGDKPLEDIGNNLGIPCESTNNFQVRSIDSTFTLQEICAYSGGTFSWLPIIPSPFSNCIDIRRVNAQAHSGFDALGGVGGDVITECQMNSSAWTLLHWSVDERLNGIGDSIIGDSGISYDKLRFINNANFYTDVLFGPGGRQNGFSTFANRLAFSDGNYYQLSNGGGRPCWSVAMASNLLSYTHTSQNGGNCQCVLINIDTV